MRKALFISFGLLNRTHYPHYPLRGTRKVIMLKGIHILVKDLLAFLHHLHKTQTVKSRDLYHRLLRSFPLDSAYYIEKKQKMSSKHLFLPERHFCRVAGKRNYADSFGRQPPDWPVVGLNPEKRKVPSKNSTSQAIVWIQLRIAIIPNP